MATPTSWPSWAYNETQPAVVVQSLEAFEHLPAPGAWSDTPYPMSPGGGPVIPPGTVFEALLAILLVLTQRLPLPPAPESSAPVVTATAPHHEAEPKPAGRMPARAGKD